MPENNDYSLNVNGLRSFIENERHRKDKNKIYGENKNFRYNNDNGMIEGKEENDGRQ